MIVALARRRRIHLRLVGLRTPSLTVGQEGISAERRGAAERDCCLGTTTARSPAPGGTVMKLQWMIYHLC